MSLVGKAVGRDILSWTIDARVTPFRLLLYRAVLGWHQEFEVSIAQLSKLGLNTQALSFRGSLFRL